MGERPGGVIWKGAVVMFGGKQTRFVQVFSGAANGTTTMLFVDSETGVQYLRMDTGVTVLVDANGKPLINEEYKKEKAE